MAPKPIFVQHPIERGGGWSIYAGVSKFLVAEGPGWSIDVGRALYRRLNWKHPFINERNRSGRWRSGR